MQKDLHTTLEHLQASLEEWLRHYNHDRTHQGKMYCGRTPNETFIDGKQIWTEKLIART